MIRELMSYQVSAWIQISFISSKNQYDIVLIFTQYSVTPYQIYICNANGRLFYPFVSTDLHVTYPANALL